MAFKIECRYLSGWDDAEWTEADADGERPQRFADRPAAQAALDEFFAEVQSAVRDGDRSTEESPDDYRIVEATD